MNKILDAIPPVSGVMAVGQGAGRLDFFYEQSHRVLTGFVFNFALSAALRRNLARTDRLSTQPSGHFPSYYLSAVRWMTGGRRTDTRPGDPDWPLSQKTGAQSVDFTSRISQHAGNA